MTSSLLFKLIHIISLNSKITTKQLGKELNTSQQNISHLLKKTHEEGKISTYKILIDLPPNLGMIHLLCF